MTHPHFSPFPISLLLIPFVYLAHLICLVVAGDLLLIDPHRVNMDNPTQESKEEGITYVSRRLVRGMDTGVYVDLMAQGDDFLASLWAFTPQDALVWPVLHRELEEVGSLEPSEGSSLRGRGIFTREPFTFPTECCPLGESYLVREMGSGGEEGRGGEGVYGE